MVGNHSSRLEGGDHNSRFPGGDHCSGSWVIAPAPAYGSGTQFQSLWSGREHSSRLMEKNHSYRFIGGDNSEAVVPLMACFQRLHHYFCNILLLKKMSPIKCQRRPHKGMIIGSSGHGLPSWRLGTIAAKSKVVTLFYFLFHITLVSGGQSDTFICLVHALSMSRNE